VNKRKRSIEGEREKREANLSLHLEKRERRNKIQPSNVLEGGGKEGRQLI